LGGKSRAGHSRRRKKRVANTWLKGKTKFFNPSKKKTLSGKGKSTRKKKGGCWRTNRKRRVSGKGNERQ